MKNGRGFEKEKSWGVLKGKFCDRKGEKSLLLKIERKTFYIRKREKLKKERKAQKALCIERSEKEILGFDLRERLKVLSSRN
jgi:hypothetical protein